MTRVIVKGWVIHYTKESRYRDRSTRMCVSHLSICLFRLQSGSRVIVFMHYKHVEHPDFSNVDTYVDQ